MVIYGANGWIGRSAITYLSEIAPPEVLIKNVLLIGSKPGQLKISNSTLNIEGPADAFARIEENAIFLNAAFLRRELLQAMSIQEYSKKIKKYQIMLS